MADERPKGIINSAMRPNSSGQKYDDSVERAMRLLAEMAYKLPAPVTDRWYNRQAIQVDGYRFERCRFDACDIYTTNGTFNFVQCFFANCTFYFKGPADKVIRLYNINAQEAWTRWPNLTPKVNADGTVTIQG